MQHSLAGAVLGGASCGLAGVFVILMRIPFIGVAMAHAAFAGALLGLLFGGNPLLFAILFSLAAAFLIGPLADKFEMDPNISIGIIFAGVLGIAFLCMGFIKGPRTEALQFLWGNILTISGADIWFMAVLLMLIILFIALLFKEITAVLFNRELALASGLPAQALFYAMLVLSSLVVSLSLNTIGGLLIFSLIINPAAAAYQLTYRLKLMFLLSAAFGVLASIAGLLCSYFFNAPSGAVIIMVSSAIFILALICTPKRKVKKYD
jgi:manganese/iron transport system permease protein